MTKQEIIEKIELYKIDLEFCKEAGYEIIAADLISKIKILNVLLAQKNV